MEKDTFEDLVYIPPELKIIEAADIFEKLGPAVTCSGFEGAVTGCN